MPPRPAPSRIAQALEYLQGLKSGVGEFVGGVGSNLADRARAAGGLAYEALTTDPNIGRMTTAEFSQAAADRAPTPRLDQAARDIGTIGRAIVTQPVETGKAIVRGEVERAQQAMTSPQAAGQYAGSLIDPTRLAAALRHRIPISELDVYHGTPHKYAPTEANPLGEFDASKIGTGEGAQAYGHGIYYAESPSVAESYARMDSPFAKSGLKGQAATVAALAKQDAPGGPSNAAKYLADNYDSQVKRYGKADVDAAIASLQSGTLYKADLPDEMIDRMLDWDKPLSEQPAAVQKAIRESFGDFEPNDSGKFIHDQLISELRLAEGNPTGRRLEFPYSTTESLARERQYPVLIAEKLKQAGIPGIRYLDAGSRDGGSGTRNFVVFPGEEKKVRILERK